MERLPLFLLMVAFFARHPVEGATEATCLFRERAPNNVDSPFVFHISKKNETVKLTCAIDGAYARKIGANHTHLIMLDGNDGAQMVTYPNGPSISVPIRILETGEYDFSCRMKVRGGGTILDDICSIALRVDDFGPPKINVSTFNCHSFNMERLKCDWFMEKNDAMLKTKQGTYSFLIRIPSTFHKGALRSYKCLELDRSSLNKLHYSCVIAEFVGASHLASRFMEMQFVYTEQGFGPVSQTVQIDLYAHLFLSIPKDLQVVTTTEKSALIKWNISNLAYSDIKLIYELVYFAFKTSNDDFETKSLRFSSNETTRIENSTFVSFLVNNLSYPLCRYKFQLQAKSELASDAFWSLPSTIFVVTQDKVVPSSTPVNAFTVTGTLADQDSQIVFIFWKPMRPTRQGNNTDHYTYLVEFIPTDTTKSKDAPGGYVTAYDDLNIHPPFNVTVTEQDKTWLSVILRFFQQYTVHVFALDEAGHIQQAAPPIMVPSVMRRVPPLKDVALIDHGNGTHQLFWQESVITDVKNYTVFWCHKYNTSSSEYQSRKWNKCKQLMGWKTYSPGLTNVVLHLRPENQYDLGVSAESIVGFSSGIQWVRCQYPPEPVTQQQLPAPAALHLKGTIRECKALQFQWEDVCENKAHLIREYMVMFCKVRSENSTRCDVHDESLKKLKPRGTLTPFEEPALINDTLSRGNETLQPFLYKTVAGNWNTNWFQLNDLEENQFYGISVSVEYLGGYPGTLSNFIVMKTEPKDSPDCFDYDGNWKSSDDEE